MTQKLDRMVQVLTEERDAALSDAAYERGRAEQSLRRAESLREEVLSLRGRLKELLDTRGTAAVEDGEATPSKKELELQERLRLAMDTNWRLERDRARTEKDLEGAQAALAEERQRVERLERRIRALEGELRIARSGPMD